MSGFENFSRDAAELERGIEMCGVALNVDWHDEKAVRALAREALQGSAHVQALLRDPSASKRTRGELFALGVLMLRTMQESAEIGVMTHGGPAWKAFGRALIEESGGAAVPPTT